MTGQPVFPQNRKNSKMNLIDFFELNFEEETVTEERSNELDMLFQNFIEEVPEPKKEFSIREFLNEMDESDPEWGDENDETDDIMEAMDFVEPNPMDDRVFGEDPEDEIPEIEEREEMEDEGNSEIEENDEGQQIEEENDQREEGDENLDPARVEFKERVRSFPAGVRMETKICKKCKMPYSRKSLKRHLFDKHGIETSNWEDYCDSYTVLPTFKKLELNKKTGLPQAKVRFLGKKSRTKNDVFPTNQLWGLKSFRKYVRNITRNGPKKQKKIVLSDQMQREMKTRKIAFKRFGRYAQDNKYECSICMKRKRAFNASVFCHTNTDNTVPHTFCTPCVTKWAKVKGQKCPTCRESGVPIKIYHDEE